VTSSDAPDHPDGTNPPTHDAHNYLVPLAATALGLILVGLVLGAIVVFVGWKHDIICIQASWPNTWIGDIFGQGDGPTYNSCLVPTTSTYVLAVVALATPVSLWAVFRRLPRLARRSRVHG
jgi:hypothetical protein